MALAQHSSALIITKPPSAADGRLSSDPANDLSRPAGAVRADLDAAGQAMTLREFARLSRIAHRMKGAAFVVGAAPFADACLALQQACDAAADGAIRAAYEDFVREALALDAALSERGTGGG